MARHQSGIVVAFCAAEDQTAYRGRVARKAYGVCVLQAEVGGPAMLGGAFLCKLHRTKAHSDPCKCTGDPTTLATVGERRYLVPKKLKIFL
jgi:hypothetical protein